MLIIDQTAIISPLADIEKSIKGSKIIINKSVFIDSFVKIKPTGGIGDVIIGNNTYINSGSVIYSGNGVNIGENVLISANCTIAPVNHEFMSKEMLIIKQRFKPSRGGVIIEDDVWIGSNTIILDGSIIRKGCVIGAGSLVKSELPSYSVSAGNPIKIQKYRK